MCFAFLLLSHVCRDDELGFRRAMLVANECPAASDDDGVALFGEVTAFARPSASLKQRALCKNLNGLLVIEEIGTRLAAHLLGTPAVEVFGAAIPKLNAVIHPTHHDGVLGEVEEVGLL